MKIAKTDRPSRMGDPTPGLEVDLIKRDATAGPHMRGSADNSVSHAVLRRRAIGAYILNVVKSLIGGRLLCSSALNDQHLDFRSGKFLGDSDPSRSASGDTQIGFDRTGILQLFQINELHGK